MSLFRILESIKTIDLRERLRSQKHLRKIREKFFTFLPNEAIKSERVKWYLEKIFWIGVYLSGFVLTILTATDLKARYDTSPTSLKITSKSFETLTLPDMTICLPFEPETLFHRLQSHLYPTGLNSGEELYDLDPEVDLSRLQDAFGRFFENKSWHQLQNDKWPLITLYYAQKYLKMISDAERNDQPNRKGTDLLPNTTDPIWLTLVNNMARMNVTIGQFKQSFSRKFRQCYTMSASIMSTKPLQNMANISLSTKEISSEELVDIRPNEVCYRLKLDNVAVGRTDKIHINIDRLNVQERRGSFNMYLNDPVYTVPVTVEFAGIVYLVYFEKPATFNVVPEDMYIDLSMIKGELVCSETTTKEACESECRNELIRTACECTASNLLSLPLAGTECPFDVYNRCLNFSGQADQECVSSCPNSCLRQTYAVQIDETSTPTMLIINEVPASFNISVDAFSYRVYEKVYDFDAQNVIGILGGAVGFWLGLDVIVIVHFVLVKPIVFFIGECLRRTKTTSVQNELENKKRRERRLKTPKNIAERWKKLPIDRKIRLITWLVDRTLWLGLFIGGAYITALMLIALLRQRRDTISEIVMMTNKTMTLPPAALCVPKSSFAFSEEYVSKVENYFSRADINKTVFLGNGSWPDFIIGAAFNYLLAIRSIETNTYEPLSEEYYDLKLNIFVLETFHNFLLRQSITQMELQHKCSEEMWKVNSITVYFIRSQENHVDEIKSSSGSLELTQLPAIISEMRSYAMFSICWQLPLDNYKFNASELDMIKIGGHTNVPTGFHVAFLYSNLDINPIEQSFYTFLRRSISVRYSRITEILSEVDGITRCQTDQSSPALCMSKCRATEAQKECVCSTSEITREKSCPFISDGSNRSTWNGYSKCLQLLVLKNLEETCRARCLPFCFQTTLALDEEYDILENEGFFELNISISSFKHLLIKERYLYTFEDLIAAVGGVLGFCLGLDAIFFINVVFVPIMWLIEYCLKAKSTAQSANNAVVIFINDTENIPMGEFMVKITRLLSIDTTGLTRSFAIKKVFEKLFWFVIYLIGGILTTVMCVRYLEAYNDTPTKFDYNTVRENQLMIPSATICVPLFQAELRNTPNGMAQGYNSLKSVKKKSFEQDYQYIKKTTITKDLLLTANQSWSIELLRTAHQYLILVGNFATSELTAVKATWQLNDSAKEIYNWKAIDLFATKVEQLSVNYDQLLQKFGHELQRYYPIHMEKYTKLNGSSGSHSLQVQKTALLTDQKVCYWLPSEAVSFHSLEDYLHVACNKYSLPGWAFYNDDGGCNLLCDNCWTQTISVVIPGRSTDFSIQSWNEYSLDVSKAEILTIKLNVADRYRFLPVVDGVTRCTEERTLDDCFAKCRLNIIESQCNCAWLAEEGRKCTLQRLSDCIVSIAVDNFTCTDNCLPRCETVHYDKRIDKILYRNENTAELVLEANFVEYPLLIEQLTWNFYDFVAALGGILGIWLGLHVIMFYEFAHAAIIWFFSRDIIWWREKILGQVTKFLKM